jgi:hypothetical protein
MAKTREGYGSNKREAHTFQGMTNPPPQNKDFGHHQGSTHAMKASSFFGRIPEKQSMSAGSRPSEKQKHLAELQRQHMARKNEERASARKKEAL